LQAAGPGAHQQSAKPPLLGANPKRKPLEYRAWRLHAVNF
jgi:hypothetical protein